MNPPINSKVSLRLFLGCHLTAELRLHLEKSQAWKETRIGPTGSHHLVINHFHQKEYIGFFVGEGVNLSKLKETETLILQAIQSYCPEIDLKHCQVLAFSQLFIS